MPEESESGDEAALVDTMTRVADAATLVAASVLVFSAFGKAAWGDPEANEAFSQIVDAAQLAITGTKMVPASLVHSVSIALEILIAAGMVARSTRVVACRACVAFLVLVTLVLGVATDWGSADVIPCGCGLGGTPLFASDHMLVFLVTRNGLLAALATLGTCSGRYVRGTSES